MSDIKWINAIANDSLLYSDFIRDMNERKNIANERALAFYRTEEKGLGDQALGEADSYKALMFHVNNAYKEGRKEDKK